MNALDMRQLVGSLLEKEAKTLTASGRTHIKQKNFGIPSKAENKEEKKKSGNYPIHDKAHARAALSYGSRYLSSEEYSALKKRIHAKYPDMGKKQEKEASLSSFLNKEAGGLSLKRKMKASADRLNARMAGKPAPTQKPAGVSAPAAVKKNIAEQMDYKTVKPVPKPLPKPQPKFKKETWVSPNAGEFL